MLCGLKITGIFQSTLPARGATRGQQSAGLLVHYFNPRSPHGERPLQCFRLGQGRHFNPRSPHGERRFSRFLPRFAVIISIHAPRTGSDDGSRRHFEKRGNFNPRSPHGERRIAWNSKTARSYFNPRSPHGERRWNCSKRRYTSHFNPRSPHGERRADVKLTLKQCSFQSTLPARGAT